MSEAQSDQKLTGRPEVQDEKALEKRVLRSAAALAIAGASLLGISGKPESGVGTAVEVVNPLTGENVLVGVSASSTQGKHPLGVSEEVLRTKDLQVYEVRIGGARLTVYEGSIKDEKNNFVRTVIGIFPAAQSNLGTK